MANAAAAGVPAWRFWDVTPRELYAHLRASRIAQRRDYRRTLFGAWKTENFARTQRLPRLDAALKQFDPPKKPKGKMSLKGIRAAIFGINSAMGGKVTYRKKAQPKE